MALFFWLNGGGCWIGLACVCACVCRCLPFFPKGAVGPLIDHPTHTITPPPPPTATATLARAGLQAGFEEEEGEGGEEKYSDEEEEEGEGLMGAGLQVHDELGCWMSPEELAAAAADVSMGSGAALAYFTDDSGSEGGHGASPRLQTVVEEEGEEGEDFFVH